MNDGFVCVHVYHICAWCSRRPEEGIGFPGLDLQTVVSHQTGAETQTPLEEQPVLVTSQSSLQHPEAVLEEQSHNAFELPTSQRELPCYTLQCCNCSAALLFLAVGLNVDPSPSTGVVNTI